LKNLNQKTLDIPNKHKALLSSNCHTEKKKKKERKKEKKGKEKSKSTWCDGSPLNPS
jgi:hypothetical protein